MILNTAITDKLNEKTKEDLVLRRFVSNLIEIECQGKNYKKQYENEVNKAVKERKETQ